MSTEYLERVQESKRFTDGLLSLTPAVISVELIAEADRLVEMQEAQLFSGLDSLLQDASISGPEPTAGTGNSSAHVGKSKGEEPASERAESQLPLSQEEQQYATAKIEQTISDAQFGVNFGENRYGHAWSSIDTIQAVEAVLRQQGRLDNPIASEKIRELLIAGVDERHQREALNLLILNAEQSHDRQSFMAAAERFTVLAEGRWPQDTVPYARPLVSLATRFIEAGKPVELDHEALYIALRALPYYDRANGFYPVLLARLGVALRGFDK